MHRRDFAFDLPPELIAQTPLPERSASRLLVLEGATGVIRDRGFADLPGLLSPGDLLVLNDTRVLPARLFGAKTTGGRVEILLERITGPHTARVQLRSSKSPKAGTALDLPGGARATVTGRSGEHFEIEVDREVEAYFSEYGNVPLPPYIDRTPEPADTTRYQTVFARAPGSVAAPTAGLHFDVELLGALDARGVEHAFLTLHVGAGTFAPVRVDEIETHRLHAERVCVPADVVERIERTRERGGRVVAVGTTVVRSLESAARGGTLAPFDGETSLFIYPGFEFQVVDAMVTNFHLPESSLLMLVCAFAGREHTLAAYRHAVAERYRFFSYGDAMFVTPASARRAQKPTAQKHTAQPRQ